MVQELQQTLRDTNGVSYMGWIAEIRRMAENEKELSKSIKAVEDRLGAGGSKLDTILASAGKELDALRANSSAQAQQFQDLSRNYWSGIGRPSQRHSGSLRQAGQGCQGPV